MCCIARAERTLQQPSRPLTGCLAIQRRKLTMCGAICSVISTTAAKRIRWSQARQGISLTGPKKKPAVCSPPPYPIAVGKVVQVDPGTVGEAQRGPLPGLGQEVAPLAVDPPLPGHVDLAPEAALSSVSDPAYDLDTRQRIIVAPVLLRPLLNEALGAELVLGIHHLPCSCEAQIIGELRGCDRQVHGVTVVGPLGLVVTRREA